MNLAFIGYKEIISKIQLVVYYQIAAFWLVELLLGYKL